MVMAKSDGTKKHWFRYLVAGLAAAATVGAAAYRLVGIRAGLKEKAEEDDDE